MKKPTLIEIGSRDDVQPIVALGCDLQDDGYADPIALRKAPVRCPCHAIKQAGSQPAT
jgi:hypothetical protein